MAKQIFRQESLDRLSSPEELDRLFTVVGIRAWIPLAALGFLLVTAIVWSIFGRIPETADGAGVLINPGRVVGVPAPYGGQIVELRMHAGELVKKGDILAIVNQPDLYKQLEQAKAKLREARQTHAKQVELEATRMRQEKILRGFQVELIQKSIKNIKDLTAKMTKTNEKQIVEQRNNLSRNQTETQNLYRALTKKVEDLRQLRENKLVTIDSVLGAQSNLVETNLQLTNLDLKLAELDMKAIDTKQFEIQQSSRVADLEIQHSEIGLKATNSELEISQSKAARESGLRELEDRIALLRVYLAEQGYITSQHTGRVLELSVQPGQVMSWGARIGAMEIEDDANTEPELKTLAYFPLRAGKRIQPGMAVRVTPATVERERHGSIVGEVTRVSPFPVSAEAAAARIGSPEIVQTLMQPGGMIEVEIKLERDADTFSGFRWTSVGPQLKFGAGITAGVRVTIEEREPITYLFPILRSSMGGQ